MQSNESPIRKGDIVRLRFGRGKMSVLEVDQDGATCLLLDSGDQVVWVALQCLVRKSLRPRSASMSNARAVVGFD
jgi:hypothetical protein